MNLSFILDTIDNVKKLNQSKEFREWADSISHQIAPNIALGIVDSSLSDNEKDEAFSRWAMLSVYCRVQMVKSGQKEWGFPEHPFCDSFLDLYMKLPFQASPIKKYILLPIISEIGDWALQAIDKGEILMPDILNDLGEIAASEREGLQQTIKDFAASLAPGTEIPIFSQDVAIDRIANRLAKPFVAKANRDINDSESRWNDALEGVWKGTEALLKQPAMENYREAFAGSKLDNYLREAIKNQLGQEIRKIERAKKKAEGYTELAESDLALVKDDEGKLVSPLELLAEMPQEDRDLVRMEYVEALQFSNTEYTIWTLRLDGKTKTEVAKELGISRPTLNRHLRIIRERLRDLTSAEFGVSRFRPGSIKVGGEWRPCPDPTAYMAMVNIMRQELLKLTK